MRQFVLPGPVRRALPHPALPPAEDHADGRIAPEAVCAAQLDAGPVTYLIGNRDVEA